MDQLLRGRQGGTVRGVAQRLRHDAGGRPLHGTACAPPSATNVHTVQSKQLEATC